VSLARLLNKNVEIALKCYEVKAALCLLQAVSEESQTIYVVWRPHNDCGLATFQFDLPLLTTRDIDIVE
jgi:hypothetical protein